jgi:micrococcal nuclease
VLKLIIVALLLAGAAVAADFSAKVIGIVDGDTIDVLVSDRDPIRVRLFGIDTPEKKQPWFAKAKEYTAKAGVRAGRDGAAAR